MMNARMRLLAQKTEVLLKWLRILQRASTIEVPDGFIINMNIGTESVVRTNVSILFLIH